MRGFNTSSANPIVPLKTRFPVKINTKNIVVKDATILQETAFAKLLIGFSISNLLCRTLSIGQCVSIINPF